MVDREMREKEKEEVVIRRRDDTTTALAERDGTIEDVSVAMPTSVERYARVEHDLAIERRARLRQITQLIGLFFGALEGAIGLRVLLLLLGANRENAFMQFILAITGPFAGPFDGLVTSPAFGGAVLDLPGLIAILVYAMVGWAVIRLLMVVLARPTGRRISTYERQKRDEM